MSYQDEMGPEDGLVSPALIKDMQAVCREIRDAVGKIGNACARIELFDPGKVTQQEFVAAGAAFQAACQLSGACMQKMQAAMERHGG